MRHQMKDAGREGGHAAAQEHITEFRNRGISEDFLDIRLGNTNGRCEQSRQDADNRNHRHCFRGTLVDHMGACHHVHTRSDHGGSVDQG